MAKFGLQLNDSQGIFDCFLPILTLSCMQLYLSCYKRPFVCSLYSYNDNYIDIIVKPVLDHIITSFVCSVLHMLTVYVAIPIFIISTLCMHTVTIPAAQLAVDRINNDSRILKDYYLQLLTGFDTKVGIPPD